MSETPPVGANSKQPTIPYEQGLDGGEFDTIDIGHISEYWHNPREAHKPQYLTIATNDTLCHPSFVRGSVVLVDQETQILNLLLDRENEAISAAEAAALLGMDDGYQFLHASRSLMGLGIVEGEKLPRIEHKLGVPYSVTNTPDSKFRLNQSLVIRDRREAPKDFEEIDKVLNIDQAISDVHENLRTRGYDYIPIETVLGHGRALTAELETIFRSGAVQRVEGDVPLTRKRARDVLLFRDSVDINSLENNVDNRAWTSEQIYFKEADSTIVIPNSTSNIKDRPKEYPRVLTCDHPLLKRYASTLPLLVPPEERRPSGILGVNFFDTSGDVVNTIHKDGPTTNGKDGDGFVFILVARKVGRGARTRLYGRWNDLLRSTYSLGRPRYSQDILPGGLLVFRDEDFFHDVTQLFGNRWALVSTINYDLAA